MIKITKTSLIKEIKRLKMELEIANRQIITMKDSMIESVNGYMAREDERKTRDNWMKHK